MQCTRPITIYQPYKNPVLKGLNYKKFPKGIVVPCGKCLGCRLAKAREWSLRCLHEMYYWEDYCFVTLTYDDEHLPENKSLSKDELQKFFKRVRKTYENKIKYYACGEYGESPGGTHRPHYHAIIFGVSFDKHTVAKGGLVLDGPIKNLWNKGNVHMGTVTYESCRYVAQYIDKKYFGEKQKKEYHDKNIEVPFQICSQGLGLKFALENSERMHEYLYTTLYGIPTGLPRYYKKKLNIDTDKMLEHSISNQMRIYNHYYKLGVTTKNEIEEAIKKAREQNEMTLQGRLKLTHNNSKM